MTKSEMPNFISVNSSKSNRRSDFVDKVKAKALPYPQTADLPAPWKGEKDSVPYPRGPVGLHQELEDFYLWLAPSPASHQLRMLTLQRFQQVINKLWPQAKVEAFGSFRTGLYLPSSDLDLVIFGRWEVMPFRTLERELVASSVGAAGSVSVLDTARVPLVKYCDSDTGIKVDVSFNMVSGLHAVQVVNLFKKKFPQLPALCTLLKQLLLTRDLASVFTGGLSSFSITLMIISFFQLHHRRDVASKKNNLGVLLLEFLQLYGQNFNYRDVGISISQGGSYLRKEMITEADSTEGFWLENPLDPSKNVAGGTYRMPEVTRAFSKAFQVLSSKMRSMDPTHSYLAAIFKDCDTCSSQFS